MPGNFHTDDNKALIEWPSCFTRQVTSYQDIETNYERRMMIIRHAALMDMDDLNWFDHTEYPQ